jgi:hypothetical protein
MNTERNDGWSNGWPISEPADEADGRWWEPWPVCPDGNPQELRHALGFRERNIGELELRVELGGHDRGVCQLIVEERDDEVFVRVVVCCMTRTTNRRWLTASTSTGRSGFGSSGPWASGR